jgi:hypothetical protein
MAQRVVPILLKRPEQYHAKWEPTTIELVESRRWEIIADIMDLLKAEAPPLQRFSRWSTWEQAVLARVAEPSECQAVIVERQAEIDDDLTGAEMVRNGFREELVRAGFNPDADVVWIKSRVAAQIVNEIENEAHRPFPKAMAHLYTLSIPEIRKSNRGDQGRGCIWTGAEAGPDAGTKMFNTWTR